MKASFELQHTLSAKLTQELPQIVLVDIPKFKVGDRVRIKSTDPFCQGIFVIDCKIWPWSKQDWFYAVSPEFGIKQCSESDLQFADTLNFNSIQIEEKQIILNQE